MYDKLKQAGFKGEFTIDGLILALGDNLRRIFSQKISIKEVAKDFRGIKWKWEKDENILKYWAVETWKGQKAINPSLLTALGELWLKINV